MNVFYGDYELCDDQSRISMDVIYQWLHDDAYWSKGRSRTTFDKSVEHSHLLGVLSSRGETVGCVRVVTDQATFAWVCDVFVEPAHRGVGVGSWMVARVVDYWLERGVPRVLLATRDAHEVYSKVGFSPLAHPSRFMEIDHRPQS
ncbi:MAG: GNAT family N-acetyltransferase [Acidimicrobiales bacterium]